MGRNTKVIPEVMTALWLGLDKAWIGEGDQKGHHHTEVGIKKHVNQVVWRPMNAIQSGT